MMTLTAFLADVASLTSVITDGIGIFMTPPLVWFVALAMAVAGIKVAKRLVPRKRG